MMRWLAIFAAVALTGCSGATSALQQAVGGNVSACIVVGVGACQVHGPVTPPPIPLPVLGGIPQ